MDDPVGMNVYEPCDKGFSFHLELRNLNHNFDIKQALTNYNCEFKLPKKFWPGQVEAGEKFSKDLCQDIEKFLIRKRLRVNCCLSGDQ